jgi:hypothetical protein
LRLFRPALAEREAPEGFDGGGPGLEFLDAEWLLEQACAMDPNPEAFLRWVEWAERSKPEAAEVAANAWRQALPNDPRPLLRLMEQAERRNALKKAMGFLRQAEVIDGVNTEVRKARLRLLILTATRHIKQGKAHLAEPELAELEALPQARENDRPAFVAALRVVAALASGNREAAESLTLKLNQMLGSPLAGAIIASAAGSICDMRLSVQHEEAPGRWIEALPRVFALSSDLGFDLSIPEIWTPSILAELRRLRPEDAPALERFCLIVLRQENLDLAFEATAAGLSLAKGNEALFLFLRAKALPPMQCVRSEDCLKAAAALARQNNNATLGAEVRQYWNETTVAGTFGVEVPVMGRRQAERVLRREREATQLPPAFDEEFDDPFELPSPRRRRRRSSRPWPGQEELPF